MARFDRQVERQKSKFNFSHKEIPKQTKFSEFKDNFNFRWIKINIRTVVCIVLDFLIVTIAVIPLLMEYFSTGMSFILGHGIVTSLLVVLTFYFINENKPSILGLLSRYCFMVLLLGATSSIAALIV